MSMIQTPLEGEEQEDFEDLGSRGFPTSGYEFGMNLAFKFFMKMRKMLKEYGDFSNILTDSIKSVQERDLGMFWKHLLTLLDMMKVLFMTCACR